MTEGRRTKQRRTVGDILSIDLGDGSFTYATVLHEPLMAFHSARAKREMTPEEVAASPVVFRIWVMNHAITSGRWRRVGHLPQVAPMGEVRFFKKDPISKQLSIYATNDSGESREFPATPDECRGLECAAVWEPEHVEDRLRDYFAGRPNQWVESMRP